MKPRWRTSGINAGFTCGSWRVLRRAERQPGLNQPLRFVCECAIDIGGCGKVATVGAGSLRTRSTSSCGCRRGELLSKSKATHGFTRGKKPIPEYQAWAGMKERCFNSNAQNFKNYGARGIRICDRWNSDFLAFFSDIGPKPRAGRGCSIDRRDNNGSYTCGRHELCDDCRTRNAAANCRWATSGEQHRNTRRGHVITHNGETMNIIDWGAKVGVHPGTLARRLRGGWTISDALALPGTGPFPARRFNLLPAS